MNGAPPVGSILLARGPHRMRSATQLIDIQTGTRLEVIRFDERWDNTHAMIIRRYVITLDLRLLDGPHQGELLTLDFRDDVVDFLEEREPDFRLPGWLTPSLFGREAQEA